MPANLRLVKAERLPISRRRDGDDARDFLQWDDLESIDVDSGSTWPAFWQLLRMGDASPSAIQQFTERWGMLRADWDALYGGGENFGFDAGDLSVDTWRRFAKEIRAFVELLAATSNGELVGLDALGLLSWRDHWWPDSGLDATGRPILPPLGTWFKAKWEHLLQERHGGEGLESQRRLLTWILNSEMAKGDSDVYFIWDETGRRLERESLGLDGIAYSHMATLFLSGHFDVLVCSICGTPYPFDDSVGRHPRFGTRRYCSDECRREGKRESNRQSWSRNGARWRRQTRKK
jgi:hypothetical protein